MSAIADEILSSLEEFCAMLAEHDEGPPGWDVLAEDAPLVFGKGNRDRRIELAKEGLCSFCRPHRGDNRTWHRPKPDRHKNHRRS